MLRAWNPGATRARLAIAGAFTGAFRGRMDETHTEPVPVDDLQLRAYAIATLVLVPRAAAAPAAARAVWEGGGDARRAEPSILPRVPSPHTHLNLQQVEDAAVANGFGDRWEARVARTALDAQHTGVTLFRLRPHRRSPFAHRHRTAEEVYVILAGGGRVKLGDELRDVAPLDAIRVAPEVVRAFEAGPDGLEYVAFGPHHGADGEQVGDPWIDGG